MAEKRAELENNRTLERATLKHSKANKNKKLAFKTQVMEQFSFLFLPKANFSLHLSPYNALLTLTHILSSVLYSGGHILNEGSYNVVKTGISVTKINS